MVDTPQDRNEKKINIGMNLKSNKRMEEVLITYSNFKKCIYLFIYLRLLGIQKNLKMLGCILKKQLIYWMSILKDFQN